MKNRQEFIRRIFFYIGFADIRNSLNNNKPLRLSLLASFVFSTWLLLSAILEYKHHSLMFVFLGFFILTTIIMRVNNIKFNKATLTIAIAGSILFVAFVVFSILYDIPERNLYNFSTLITAISTAYGKS